MSRSPKVVLVGGPDVDSRLGLMQALTDEFEMSALGSSTALGAQFAAQGFAYDWYSLNRRLAPIADLRTLRQLRARFRRIGPDIVHTFDTKPGVWGSIAARTAGVPVVISTVTGLGSLYAADDLKTRAVRFIYQRLQRTACRRSDLTIFQNHDDERQLVTAGVASADKTSVILGSGVETARYAQDRVTALERDRLRQELRFQDDETVVTMIARVTRSKGVLEFMAAARAVRQRHPKVRFLLVGPADEASLDRLGPAELAELRDTLTWPGARRDIVGILAVSDIFVLPTAYREGIPRVLLEAASMGLPLVTTDSPGCNEVVQHGVNGLLSVPGDLVALTLAIEQLVEQPELRRRFGMVSRQRAVDVFELSVVAQQTRQVYRRLLAQRGRAATKEKRSEPHGGSAASHEP